MRKTILIEGFSPEEILNLPQDQIESLVLTGEPLVFQAGSARILGEFQLRESRLIVELAQIEGGGEGVLPTLWVLADKYARQRKLKAVEWIIHTINCAEPNPKLRPFMERRGFTIQEVPGHGQAYYYLHDLDNGAP